MMTATLNGQLERVLLALPAADLATLARDAHAAQCLGCRNELCAIGMALETAARPDRTWCPSPNGAAR
jgi:hypothetical protein